MRVNAIEPTFTRRNEQQRKTPTGGQVSVRVRDINVSVFQVIERRGQVVIKVPFTSVCQM